jgi:hypothetical protein
VGPFHLPICCQAPPHFQPRTKAIKPHMLSPGLLLRLQQGRAGLPELKAVFWQGEAWGSWQLQLAPLLPLGHWLTGPSVRSKRESVGSVSSKSALPGRKHAWHIPSTIPKRCPGPLLTQMENLTAWVSGNGFGCQGQGVQRSKEVPCLLSLHLETRILGPFLSGFLFLHCHHA